MLNKALVKEKLLYLVGVGGSIVMLLVLIMTVWIGYEAKSLCQNAVDKYGSDCVAALALQLDDPTESYRARNHAIWALGQIGDERSLPTLQKHYTGLIPERESLTDTLSQYELKKAIALVSGGPNPLAFFWRGFATDWDTNQ